MYFNDVHINIYNSFRLKNEYVNILDEKLQSIYVTFINNLYLNYNHI